MNWFQRLFKPEASYLPDEVLVNADDTPVSTIVAQMHEPRALPMGDAEFTEWSDRIISGALVPCTDKDSLLFALSTMLMHLGPTESHKPDAYFIHALRKAAINEVAHARMKGIKEAAEAKKKALDEAKSLESAVSIQ